MNFESIKPGIKVTIRIKRDATVASFETTVIEVVGKCLVCKPVLHENKLVNFAIPQITRECIILDSTTNKLYSFGGIEIKAGYYKKTTLCHLINLNTEPVEINRRNDFRQYIGLNGIAEPFHRPRVDVIIQDLSNHGVGFLAEEKGNFEVGRHVTISFEDEGKFRFILECKIVRERHTDRGIDIGCVILNPPHSYRSYLMYKQLAERRKVLGLEGEETVISDIDLNLNNKN